MTRKIISLGIFLTICIALLGSGIGVAMSFSVRSLSSTRFSIFEQTHQESRFTITSTKTIAIKTSTTIKVQVTNNDLTTHSANVTVVCYDVNGDFLQESAQLTGEVGGGQYIYLTYTFNSVSRYDFGYSEIIIEDLT